jgi:hypothetical protein
VANRRRVRNRALHDQLYSFAAVSAERLSTAVLEGAEIPFEVDESPGATSVLYRYRPLSGQFVREHMAELRAADGFAPALLALSKLEGSSAYLRVLGQTYVPASERDRAEAVLQEFLVRLYEDMTAFELDETRFERVYAELESTIYDDTVVTTVLAPLSGVRLGDERWELGSGLALARGDACDAPPEAVWSGGHEDGEPNTLILLTVEAPPQEPPPLTAARLGFRKLLTALRLFKPGAASLGAEGRWRLDEGPWQSLPLSFTGHPRSGGYRLHGPERADLVELFELIRMRPLQGGLSWALARFEMGCGQAFALEGLSDHLLALGALLDGDDVAPANVATRLAALCAEPRERDRLRERIEQAFALQRRLMRGELGSKETRAADAPDRIAADLEDTLRAVLKDMVCGYLDADVKHTADELLRLEAEARPDPPPEPRPARGSPFRGRRGRKKPEPVVETWEEVVPGRTGGSSPGPPREREFVITRKAASATEDLDEPETKENLVVAGVREVTTDEDVSDWGFDDDPADYSAAV